MVKENITIEFRVEDYLKTTEAKNAEEYYISATDIKPKNIYTKSTDFGIRYRQELKSLISIFKKISFPVNIIEQIPEIREFFPFLNFTTIKNEKSLTEGEDIKFIFKEIEELFPSINAREYGEYYSNDRLIKIILDNLDIDITLDKKVIDPASGAGFFLFYYLERLIENTPGIIDLDLLRNNIHGYDIFPYPIIVSKLLLGKLLEKNKLHSESYTLPNIKIKNTLKSLSCISSNQDKFDIVIGNPPYFRIDPHEENNICKCVSYGHNYIHNLFFHWSIQHLNDGGVLGLIIPQSILSGYYYQKMRSEVMDELSIELIVTNKEHEKSFSVQQDIMLFLARKTKYQSENYKIGVSNGSLSKITTYSINAELLKNSRKVIPLFKNRKEYKNFELLSKNSIVKHLASFSINTGNYVWNQNKENCFLKNVPKSIPLINGSNITLSGVTLNSNRANTFPFCIPDKKKYVKKEKLLVYRRMSPIGNNIRMVASIIDCNQRGFQKGYVLENHVNFISGPSHLLENVLSYITSFEFNELINSFCHTNQVSSNDLKTIFELLKTIKHD